MKNKIMYLNNQTGKWQKSNEWMDFFYFLGRYVQSKQSISIYISYMDYYYPGLLMSIGILDKYYEEVSLNKTKLISDFKNEIELGSDFVVKRGFENEEFKWMKASNLEVYTCPYFKEEVLRFDVKRAGQTPTKSTIPIDRWLDDVRISANYRNTAGSIVTLDDEITSDLLKVGYSRKLNHIKMFNHNVLNLFGYNLNSILLDKSHQLRIKYRTAMLPVNEYIMFESSDFSYKNTRIVTKNNKQNIREEEARLFFNANNALRYSENYGKKNIYLTTRKQMDTEYNSILFANLDSRILRKQKINNEIIDYFKQLNIRIPKGVDIFAHE